MRIAARLVMTVVGLGLVVASAHGADHPIGAQKLQLRRSKASSKLTFVSRDAGIVLPTLGTPDDPVTGTPGGVTIELFSKSEGSASVAVPGGFGKPGWSATQAGTPTDRFSNSLAPNGISVVKALILRHGSLVKIVTKSVPLPLLAAHQRVGIRLTMGGTRLCALFQGAAIVKDAPGNFVGSRATAVALADCNDATLYDPPQTCGGADTLQVIQQRIFDVHGCNVGTCHGNFPAANLDLRPGASFVELVNIPADNAAANAAGKMLVKPGDPAASFLSQKLHGTIDFQGGEGSAMPLVGNPLSADELAVIDAWIAAGAPQEGEVTAAPCLAAPTYQAAPPLQPPPGGYQLVLNGPVLQPGQEQEGCMWVPVPSATNFDVAKWEFSLNPGTHHFAIFEYNRAGAPTVNVWTPNDFGCFSGTQFGNNISGAPQAPYYVDAYPAGVARRLTAGHYLGLNAHYFNSFSVPIQMKVWINMHPYAGTPDHLATTIVDIDDTYGINIPPNTQQIYPPVGNPRARWTNTSGGPFNVMFLGGHMHFRGLRFTVWASNGTKLYESFDWAHPNTRLFTSPYVLPPGDYIEYECYYDNGVTKPVRRDTNGNPTNLIFGVSVEDAMCIVTGSYYQ